MSHCVNLKSASTVADDKVEELLVHLRNGNRLCRISAQDDDIALKESPQVEYVHAESKESFDPSCIQWPFGNH